MPNIEMTKDNKVLSRIFLAFYDLIGGDSGYHMPALNASNTNAEITAAQVNASAGPPSPYPANMCTFV
jgi:hypothetical protein